MPGTVRLRGVVLGEGRTKIAAPLCATSPAQLLAQAEEVAAAGVDLAEWRLDHLLAAPEAESLDLARLLVRLRGQLGDLPLLVTVRTAAEGGEIALAEQAYARMLAELVETAAVPGHGPDAVDVEIRRGSVLAGLAPRASELDVTLVASAHDFRSTPPRAEMVRLLEQMAGAGADVVKLAVMPADPADVLELLAASHQAAARLPVPVITMAMGPAGIVSRIAGEAFGSAVTFGAVTGASAPGQVAVERLRDAVDLVHESLQP